MEKHIVQFFISILVQVRVIKENEQITMAYLSLTYSMSAA